MLSTRLDWLLEEPLETRQRLANIFTRQERLELEYHWHVWARDPQIAPEGDWRVWMVMAGRGFGKTRAGAEWVRLVAENDPTARIALVADNLAEARSVMVEGESGILACSPPDRIPKYEPSLQRLSFPNGAQALLYSASEPESLRGPQHSHAWCDEIGKWPLSHDRATRCWDNLLLGLRLGGEQKIMVTTTPRAVPLVRRVVENESNGSTVITRGTTQDNRANLPPSFIRSIEEEFGLSQLARQEIRGELIEDIEGALWTRAMCEHAREFDPQIELTRVVVAVDPPASAHGDACGIVVAGCSADGLGHVLADCSVEKASPERWANAVAMAAQHWGADRVIAEANQGGAMVESVLRAADIAMPVKLVHASRGKSARAEPVAALYETGRIRHRGNFPQLEDQLCGMMAGGEYCGPGLSPDRADALVWAMTELLLQRRLAPLVRPL